MEYSPQYHALAFTDSHYGVGNEDYLYYSTQIPERFDKKNKREGR